MKDNKKYWLDNPKNVTKLCHALYLLCAGLVFADALYHRHTHFALENWFGFYGLYGFVSCVILVLTAKRLRKVLGRKEDYYDSENGKHVR